MEICISPLKELDLLRMKQPDESKLIATGKPVNAKGIQDGPLYLPNNYVLPFNASAYVIGDFTLFTNPEGQYIRVLPIQFYKPKTK